MLRIPKQFKRVRLSQKTIELIFSLCDKGVNLYDIAKQADVAYTTAVKYSWLRRNGFYSVGEYKKYCDLHRNDQLPPYYSRNPEESRTGRIEFSKLLRETLAKYNLTQRYFAKLLRISESTVSGYVNARHLPKKQLIPNILSLIENLSLKDENSGLETRLAS